MIKKFYLNSPAICVFLGAGGAGKTRLCTELTKQWKHCFPSSGDLENLVLVYSEIQEVYKECLRSAKETFPSVKITTLTKAEDALNPALYKYGGGGGGKDVDDEVPNNNNNNKSQHNVGESLLILGILGAQPFQ
jgi:hypothetical protein